MAIQVKICGLTRREDALHAAERGADLLGVVVVPGSPRSLTPAAARELLEGIRVPSVVVVSDLGLSQVVEAAETVGASVIQLHGAEAPEMAERLRDLGPWKVWKAVRVRDAATVEEGLRRFGARVDGLLLDTWHSALPGGTGRVFPWSEVERIRGGIPPALELVIAGGLTPANVGEAVARLRPHVVDVSSGVEARPGIKDPRVVEAFIQQVRAAQGGAQT